MKEVHATLLAAIESELPLRLDEVDQYWGSCVMLGGRTPGGSPAYLRVYLCDWKLARDDDLFATSDGSVQENRDGLWGLLGTQLMSLKISLKRRRVRSDFDSGHVLMMYVNLEAYGEDATLFFSSWPIGMISFKHTVGIALEPHADPMNPN
ncbi:hypothetical protein [Roseateles noduli]|uniref:hypothetical protein n=1 Tax=Roseateles noduli TaxID=2052484 RepID=UPI003D660BF4